MLTIHLNLLAADLRLFDGEGGAAPAGDGAAAAPAAEASTPAPEVRYGKQPEQTAAPQQADTSQTEKQDPAERRKAYRELVSGEWKAEHDEEFQRAFNKSFKDYKQLQNKLDSLQPILNVLEKRYGADATDPDRLAKAVDQDTSFFQYAADEAGLSVEEYKNRQLMEAENNKLKQQNAFWMADYQTRQWKAEAAVLKEKYPEFDLDAMMKDSTFMLLLKNKYPMEQAYRAAAVDQFEAQAAQRTEKAVTANIRARGARPAEAGSSASPAFTVKDDVSKLSDKDVLAVLSQISGGKKVSFS